MSFTSSYQYQHSKINTTAQTRLKEYQLLNVHDNFMKSVDQYLNCNKKVVNVEQAYRSKLINQSNITQYFFQALNDQLDPSERGTILARTEKIAKQLEQIPKDNKFINGLVKNYKQCLLQNKTKLVEFPKNLKKEATKEQKQKILLDIVYGVSKTRNQDDIMLEKLTNTKQIPRKSNQFAEEQKIKFNIQPAKKQFKSSLYPQQKLIKSSLYTEKNQIKSSLYPEQKLIKSSVYTEKKQLKPKSEYSEYGLKPQTNPQNKMYKSDIKSLTTTAKQTNQRITFTKSKKCNF